MSDKIDNNYFFGKGIVNINVGNCVLEYTFNKENVKEAVPFISVGHLTEQLEVGTNTSNVESVNNIRLLFPTVESIENFKRYLNDCLDQLK